jgi:V8-like Glu-specific endopeptidase
MALVSMSTQASTLDEEGRQRIVDTIVSDSAAIVRAHTDDAGFAYEIGTNVVLAKA